MNIFNHFQHINLTTDQSNAVDKLSEFLQSEERVFVLQGYAGSGKTTLLKGVIQHLQNIQKKYQLMAPTGRAAKVINQKTGFEASTIHKGIYSFDELKEIKQSDEENDVSFLYQFELRNNTELHDAVFIVDEASMVSDAFSEGEFFRFGSGYLLKDLIQFSRVQESTTTSKIIFIGDPAQLPPIGMNFSPALDTNYLLEEYELKVHSTEMKEVKRQDANNQILHAAKNIRQCLTSGYFNDFNLSDNNKDIFNPSYEDYLETYKKQQGKKIIICYKNKTALDLNISIRNDKYGDNLPLQSSDTVIIGANNYKLDIMNGEFAVVTNANPTIESRDIRFYDNGGKTQTVRLTWRRVSLLLPNENGEPKNVSGYVLENYLHGDNYLKPEEQRALYVDFKNRHPKLKKGTEEFKEAIISDKYFNCIKLKYGYAVTCHKAQGGEWDNAFVFWDRGIKSNFNFYESEQDATSKSNADFYRWAYTAVTRASKKLFCVNPPYFSSFSKMNFIDIEVQNAFNELTDQKNESVEINLEDEVLMVLENFGLQNENIKLQDHFIELWYNVKKQNIDIVDWKRIGYEIRYLFKREEQTAGFKFWVNGKNKFKANFQQLPGQTNSDELFNAISEIAQNLIKVFVNRKTTESILNKVTFDIELEENKPFLKHLFDSLNNRLNLEGVIINVMHLNYRERYVFEKGNSTCTIDFEYDNKGFFGRVLPLEKQCNDQALVSKLKLIIENLKATSHAI